MKTRYFSLPTLVAIVLALVTLGCKRNAAKELLHSIPQDAGVVLAFDGTSLYKKAGGEALEGYLGSQNFSQLSLLRKCIDVKTILLFREAEEGAAVATAKVVDFSALKDLLVSTSLSVQEEDGIFSAQFGEEKLFFNKHQAWLAFDEKSEPFALESIQRSKDKGPSFADNKGIENMFRGDMGFFINPFKSMAQAERLLDIDAESLPKNRIVGNISFEERDIKADFEIIDTEGKLFKNPIAQPAKIDKKVLEYFPKNTDFLFVQGVKNKDFQKSYESLPQTWRSPELRTLFTYLDGTIACGLEGSKLYDFPDTIILLSQVKKGKGKEAQQAILSLLKIEPEKITYVGDVASFSNFFLGTIFVGYTDDIAYLSLSPIGLNKPSFLENDLAGLINADKGYFFVDMKKESILNVFLQESSYGRYYDLDGFLAASGTESKGELVFHNEASTDKNILEGIVRAIAKADKEEKANREEVYPLDEE